LQRTRRYFFDLIAQDRIITDAEGHEFAVAEEAKAHALQVVAEIARNTPKEGSDRRGILVRDETGVEIFRVPLSSRPV
jgi:hypothetical protein